MPDLAELYQSIILDHNRRPRNFGELEGADRRAEGTNPLCGDRVTVWLRLDGDRIADARFTGSGCAISRASASLMTAAVKGRTAEDADRLFAQVHDLVTGRGDAPADPELRSLAALSGVARFPMRVKCASLAWHALRAALHPPAGGEPAAATTE